MHTYIRLMSSLVLLALLAACRGAPAAPAPAATSTATAPAASDAETAAATAAAPGAGANSGRIVRHPLGETHVPDNPQRVVILDPYATLQTALDLGVPVVGAPHFPSGNPFVDFLPDDVVAGIENIGWVDAINLEVVARLEPDLIVGWSNWVEPIYPELSQIAPTVAIEPGFTPEWKESLRATAAVFGKAAQLEADLAAYEARIQEFRAAMGDRLETFTVSLVRVDDSQLRVYTSYQYNGAVLEEAGLRRPPNEIPDDPEENFIALSLELVPELQGDVMIAFAAGGGVSAEDAERVLAQYQSNPLWATLPAVQNDQIYFVDADHWFSGASIRGVNLILDDLFAIFVEE